MIPITKEMLDDTIISVDDIMYKKLVTLECDPRLVVDHHRGQSHTVDINGVQYPGAVVKSKYKLRNGQTRLRFIVDERKRYGFVT